MTDTKTKSRRVLGTQQNIKLNGWTCQIGTIDKDKPTSSFIKIGGYCNPGNNKINEVMNKFQYNIERHINKVNKELLQKYLPNNFNPIKTIEWSDTDSAKQYNKWSYFAIEVHNFHNNVSWSNESFQDDLRLILYSIIDYLKEYEYGIVFNQKRLN